MRVPVGEAALDRHHEFQHVGVVLALEEDFAGEELVDGAGGGPNVDGEVVGRAQDYLGRAVVPGLHVVHQVGLVGVQRRAEVAQLHRLVVVGGQDVVRLY